MILLRKGVNHLKKKLDEFESKHTKAIRLGCPIVWIINKNFFLWDLMDGMPPNIRFSFKKCICYFKIAQLLPS